MRLLVFSPYYPPHIGGLESHADEFNKHLSEKGVPITVFTPRLPRNAKENEIRHQGAEIIRFPAFEVIPNYPIPKFWSLKFWRLFLPLFREKPSLVISRTRFFSTSMLALIYAKIKRTPWIHIEHGSDYVQLNSPFFSALARKYDHTFGWLVLKSCDRLIANSLASAGFCQRISGREAAIIYRGVENEEIEDILPDAEAKSRYPAKIIITFIGRLIDGKGVADLIESLARLKRDDFICFIIADGPQKDILMDLAKKNDLEEKIIFWGYLPHNKAMGLLKISDIFVNPSYTEGLPSSVIEAALCRKAIVATDVGGTPEIIADQKSGLLVPPRDVNQLKDKIEFLIGNNEARDGLGINAYNGVREKFNWDRSIEKYISIFSEL